jgi:hypothetical protein
MRRAAGAVGSSIAKASSRSCSAVRSLAIRIAHRSQSTVAVWTHQRRTATRVMTLSWMAASSTWHKAIHRAAGPLPAIAGALAVGVSLWLVSPKRSTLEMPPPQATRSPLAQHPETPPSWRTEVGSVTRTVTTTGTPDVRATPHMASDRYTATRSLAAPLTQIAGTPGLRDHLAASTPSPLPSSRSPLLRRAGRAAPAATFRGSLAVSSSPQGAQVFINGVSVGATPLLLRDLPVGSRAVRVELQGHARWSSQVRVVANERTLAVAELRRLSNP